ncbi:hypothetical protein LEADMM068B1_06605 [Leclercia adecarboxylata]|uniref:hypothetical protein n=1 Tax=Leclercia adecarboxylata TaxID=83655 RepID=UPI003B229887
MTELTKEQRKEEIRALIAEAVDWQAIYEHPIHDKPQRDFFEGMELAMLELLALMDSAPQLPQPVVGDGWVTVPMEMTPSQMRAIQLRSEVGSYITSNLSGAYSLLDELWKVALEAAPKRVG